MTAPEESQAFTGSPILVSATQIISAHLGNNPVALSDVPGFIRTVFATLAEVEPRQASGDALPVLPIETVKTEAAKAAPAVKIDASVQPEYIICLEDGKKLRMLKRYLMSQYRMTPEQYRIKWGLPDDYPMVAPAVSEQRRQAAMDGGLGRSRARRPVSRKRRAAR